MDINNLEKFKAKMALGRMCVGTVITLSDPAVSELAGDAGMDFTWIDAEHAPHTIESVMGHIMALRGTGCAPLVRVAWNDPVILKPVLDLAPAGVIIPMVCTADEAKRAVAACKYPPAGIRDPESSGNRQHLRGAVRPLCIHGAPARQQLRGGQQGRGRNLRKNQRGRAPSRDGFRRRPLESARHQLDRPHLRLREHVCAIP